MKYFLTAFWSAWFTCFQIGLYNHFNSDAYSFLIGGVFFGMVVTIPWAIGEAMTKFH